MNHPSFLVAHVALAGDAPPLYFLVTGVLFAIPGLKLLYGSRVASKKTAVDARLHLTPAQQRVRAKYRAVTPSELADIRSFGRFRNKPGIGGGNGGTKYFSTTLKGAQFQAQELAQLDDEVGSYTGEYSIVETTFPTDEITADMQVTVDGNVSTVVIPEEKMDLLGEPDIIEIPVFNPWEDPFDDPFP